MTNSGKGLNSISAPSILAPSILALSILAPSILALSILTIGLLAPSILALGLLALSILALNVNWHSSLITAQTVNCVNISFFRDDSCQAPYFL